MSSCGILSVRALHWHMHGADPGYTSANFILETRRVAAAGRVFFHIAQYREWVGYRGLTVVCVVESYSYVKVLQCTSLCHPGFTVSAGPPVSVAWYSAPPLAEDHVHGLGQVVHRAVGRHRRVLLVAGPEGGEANRPNLKTRNAGRNRNKQGS